MSENEPERGHISLLPCHTMRMMVKKCTVVILHILYYISCYIVCYIVCYLLDATAMNCLELLHRWNLCWSFIKNVTPDIYLPTGTVWGAV